MEVTIPCCMVSIRIFSSGPIPVTVALEFTLLPASSSQVIETLWHKEFIPGSIYYSEMC